jgi:hypothetical protein
VRRRPGAPSGAAAASLPADATCRICLDGPGREGFITPCLCSGSMSYVHRRCLLRWQTVTLRDTNNDATHCEMCRGRYNVPPPPVDLRVRLRVHLRRGLATVGLATLSLVRFLSHCHAPLAALLAASSTLSIATVELMEGGPAVGWWLGGAPWTILALSLVLAFTSLGIAIAFSSLQGAVLTDRVQRRLLRNVFIQNMLVAVSVVTYFAKNAVLAVWLASLGLAEMMQGMDATPADAVRVPGGLTRHEESAAWLLALLRGWNIIGPILPLFLFVAHELRRPAIPGETGRGPVARQVRALTLVLILLILSVYCVLPLIDISAVTAHGPGGTVEQFYGRMDVLGLLNKSQPGRPWFNHQGPVWSWPPHPLVNATAESLSFSASTGGYRRRGHSPDALGAAMDHLHKHEGHRRRVAATLLSHRFSMFPPANPQSHGPPPGEPWTWTMLPLNYTDQAEEGADAQDYSAFPHARAWRPQQTFLVQEPWVLADEEEPEPSSQPESQDPWPTSFMVSGSGCDSCNGEYLRDGDHDGVPQYSFGQGKDRVLLLRYAMPTGTRYWYLSLASDLHSGKGDIYRVKSDCKLRHCVDFPPATGWTDTCTLQGQKCTEKWLEFHHWRVGGPPVPTVQAVDAIGSLGAKQRPQRRRRPAPFRLVMHAYAAPGDTVLAAPGVHTAGVSLTEHLALRGACAAVPSSEQSCEPGHPPSVLAGTGCSGLGGAIRWWLRRAVLPKLLGIGELSGILRREAGWYAYSPQECAAVWVTSPSAVIADLTIASSRDAWEATAWAATDQDGPLNPTEDINLARPTNGPFHPVALEISMGSSAIIAHCVIVGGVVVRGPRTSPLLEFLTIKHATTGLLINSHASPTVRDVRFIHVETGVEVVRWASPTLTRLHIDAAKQTGMIFSSNSLGTVSMSAVVASGTCNLAVRSGAAPVISDSWFRLAAQTGILFDDGGKGKMQRCHVLESHYAGLEIRGGDTTPDIDHSSVHGGGAAGLYVHSGGRGTLTDVTLLNNRNGAGQIAEGGTTRLLRCTLGGHGAENAVLLDVQGADSTPELVDSEIDASAVDASVAVKVSDGAAPILRGVDVHGASSAGVLVLGAVTPRLVGCSVHDNRVGVELIGAGGSTVLDSSKVYDNARSVVGSDSGHAKVHNCELSAPGVDGMGTEMSSGASITVNP